MADKRPDPKPRKNTYLWQCYLWWNEIMQMRKRHLLRISSCEKGKSNLDAQFERDVIEQMRLDEWLKTTKKMMIAAGHTVGPMWEWITSIRGLTAGSLAAQLLAQIDDIGKFDTVSKLWRFAGWAVIDGKRERCKKGKTSSYNRRLKSTCYLIGEQFITHQTPLYADIYYAEKARLRRLYPEPIEAPDSPWKYNYTASHIHRMARRKMIKIFLQHLWVKWRELDGLPVSEPYVQAIMGHTNIIQPSAT
jgi:hypothetical protein